MRNRYCMISMLMGLLSMNPAHAQSDCLDELDCESSWLQLTDADRAGVFDFAQEYMAFIHEARTELSFVAEAVRLAEANGFRPLSEVDDLAPGDKIYEVNRDRTLSVMVIGSEPVSAGFHVVGAHIDSPRLDLKPRPLYQDNEFALFQTNYHGGLKYHQWTNLPLALMGRIDKKDGTTVPVSIGLRPQFTPVGRIY